MDGKARIGSAAGLSRDEIVRARPVAAPVEAVAGRSVARLGGTRRTPSAP